jgi:predicted acetyltransferase
VGGLTLLHRGAFLIDDAEMMDIVEFFVMRKYRRHGAGEAMARVVFDRFPIRWEVRVHAKNLPGRAFWRAIIGRYVGGRFEERAWDDEKWRGPVLFFDSRDRVRGEA